MKTDNSLLICLILSGFINLSVIIDFEKQIKLEKVKTDKVVEIIWKKYSWKTKRLRVFTEIVYKNK
jgi:hypothetical protein